MARKIRQWQDLAIPETIAPPDRRCVVLYIPDEKTHIANFWGNLDRLALWWNWEKEPTHSGTLAAQVWRTVIEQGRLDFLLGNCGEPCEDCPETEPCEDCSKGGNDGNSEVGQLGLTIAELEEMVMSGYLRGKLKFIDGVLHYAVGDCDEWCPVPQEGETVVPSVQSALMAGIQSIDDWIGAGSPVTEEIPGEPHDNFQIYTTDGSLKCAKATAIVEHIWQSMVGWKEVMDNMPAIIQTSTGVGVVLASFFPGVAHVLGMASKVIVLLSNVPASTVEGQLQTDIEKEDEKQLLICDLVERMSAPGVLGGFLKTNQMTDADIIVAFERFEAIVSPHANTRALLGFFSVNDWKLATASRATTEDCGCEEFWPTGFTPGLLEGQVKYEFKEFGWASDAFPYPADNSAYNAILAGGQVGAFLGSNPVSVNQPISGGTYSSFLQAVFEFTDTVQLTGIKLFFVFPDGGASNYMQWSNMFFTTDGGGQWKYGAGWGNIDQVPEERALTADITAFSVGARTNGSVAKRAVLSQVLVSGTYLGSTFTDLPPDTIFEA